jgi:hypothetical protein
MICPEKHNSAPRFLFLATEPRKRINCIILTITSPWDQDGKEPKNSDWPSEFVAKG